MVACPGPRACGNAAVAWSPPATSRWRGRLPPTFPPHVAHAATTPCALISRCRGPKEKHPLYRDSSSCQLTVPHPYHRLLSSAVRTSSAPASYAPPPASSSHSEHHRALEHLINLSFLADERHTDPSPAHPSARPPSPPRARHGEPPITLHPKSGSPSTGLTLRPFSRRPTTAGRSDSAGKPPATREFFPPPFHRSRAEMPQGSWAAWLSRPSRAVG
jgi:hypothetical protein